MRKIRFLFYQCAQCTLPPPKQQLPQIAAEDKITFKTQIFLHCLPKFILLLRTWSTPESVMTTLLLVLPSAEPICSIYKKQRIG